MTRTQPLPADLDPALRGRLVQAPLAAHPPAPATVTQCCDHRRFFQRGPCVDALLESLLVRVASNPGITFTDQGAMQKAVELGRLGLIKLAKFQGSGGAGGAGPCVLAQGLTPAGRHYLRAKKLL